MQLRIVIVVDEDMEVEHLPQRLTWEATRLQRRNVGVVHGENHDRVPVVDVVLEPRGCELATKLGEAPTPREDGGDVVPLCERRHASTKVVTSAIVVTKRTGVYQALAVTGIAMLGHMPPGARCGGFWFVRTLECRRDRPNDISPINQGTRLPGFPQASKNHGHEMAGFLFRTRDAT